MGHIKNISGEKRTVPGLGDRLVMEGAVVEVPDDVVFAYTQQTEVWAPDGDATQKVHDAADAEQAALIGAVSDPDAEPNSPGGNEPREAWAEFAIATGWATPDQLDGMGRNQIRDLMVAGEPVPTPGEQGQGPQGDPEQDPNHDGDGDGAGQES